MRLPHNIERVLESVLGADDHLDRATRVAAANRAAAAGGGTREPTDIPAPLRPYVDKVTETPYKVDKSDIDVLTDAGLSADAIREAAYAAFLFSVMDRLADAFDFHIPAAEQVRANGHFLNDRGYTMSKLVR